MRWLLPVLCAAVLAAVEVRAEVVRIADGDTLTVAAWPGVPDGAKRGRDGDIYVRLICVDTLEIWNKAEEPAPDGLGARDLLLRLAPAGSQVVLSDAGPALELDRYGRVLAMVRPGRAGARSLQEELIAAGWSAYWRRWRDAPPGEHERLAEAEAAARAAVRGAWATRPELLARKAAERPARAVSAAPAP
jgi:endonuclease YncB( thermonuclease family)